MAPSNGATKLCRGHTDLNHGPIGLQPIALPLSYIPKTKDWGMQRSTTRGKRFSLEHLCFREHQCQQSVGGIMVSIAAFQAVDPGSIPGRRNIFFLFFRLLSQQTMQFFISISLSKNLKTKVFRYRELNPGHLGESQVS